MRDLAEFLRFALLLLCGAGVFLTLNYLPSVSFMYLIGFIVAAGFGITLLYCHVRRLPNTRNRQHRIGIVLLIVALIPFISMIVPGRITFSAFGFTVYNLMPIPGFDITVNSHGFLWFRQKTHLIDEDEVARLIDDDIEIVIIGNGWDRVAKVEASVFNLCNGNVEVLATPEAFARFNQLRSEGKRVVLLAHTTC